MALFIPLIGGTGGNVGIQSSAIVVQGLANNTLKEGNIVPQILKESVVSLINASIISLVVFIYNFFMLGDRGITGLPVSLSLFAVVMFASIFGTLVPMTLDKMKIDPALATGPFYHHYQRYYRYDDLYVHYFRVSLIPRGDGRRPYNVKIICYRTYLRNSCYLCSGYQKR